MFSSVENLRYGFDAVNLNFLVMDGISDGNGIQLRKKITNGNEFF
jgi:hypothetical protein